MIDNIVNLTVTVTAKFVDANTLLPLNRPNYEFHLFDEDLINDEYLGSCAIDSKGEVKLNFDLRQLKSFGSAFETKPDLFFNLRDGDKQIYKSDTLRSIHLNRHGEITPEMGYTFNFGTYVIK